MHNILKIFEKARDLYDQKHQVISKNISNANIPKKKSQNLEIDFSSLIGTHKVNLNVTNKNHIGFNNKGIQAKSVYPKGEKNINGNNINLKEQIEQLTENAEDIRINNDLYKQLWKIIRTSIGN